MIVLGTGRKTGKTFAAIHELSVLYWLDNCFRLFRRLGFANNVRVILLEIVKKRSAIDYEIFDKRKTFKRADDSLVGYAGYTGKPGAAVYRYCTQAAIFGPAAMGESQGGVLVVIYVHKNFQDRAMLSNGNRERLKICRFFGFRIESFDLYGYVFQSLITCIRDCTEPGIFTAKDGFIRDRLMSLCYISGLLRDYT